MSAIGPILLWEGEGQLEADIIFVHGLRGDARDTWTKGKVFWPQDLLKYDLEKAQTPARIFSWGYDARVLTATSSVSHATIFGHSENLLGDIDARPIIFVGHSLGGLVIKEALIRSSEYHYNQEDPDKGSIYKCAKGVVFLGTPHRGSNKVTLGKIASTIAFVLMQHPNDELISTLAEESDVLERQRRSFASISDNIPLACVYEEISTTVGLIVPEHSATIDRKGVQISAVPANHVDMCKYASAEEIGYQRVSGHILSFVRRVARERVEGEQARAQQAKHKTPSPSQRLLSFKE